MATRSIVRERETIVNRLGREAFVQCVLKKGRSAIDEIDGLLAADDKPERVHERVQGESNFLPAWFLSLGAERARAVCHLRFVDSGTPFVGTGFMLSESLLMTNNHVFPNKDVARTGEAHFNFEVNERNLVKEVSVFNVNPDQFFLTSENLDFTIVFVDGEPGRQFGVIPLLASPAKVGVADFVNIIQHPAGRPKEVAVQANRVQDFTEAKLLYSTDTEGGSSGSPVFDNAWQLVALHHVGTDAHNEGVRISAILKFLRLLDERERAPALSALVRSVPDTDRMGFFGIAGIAPERRDAPLERVALDFQGDADFADVGYWNIENLSSGAPQQRIESLADVIAHLKLDVFGLEEISAGAMDRLVGELRARGLNYAVQVEDVDGGQDLAILFDADVTTVEPLAFTDAQQNLLETRVRDKLAFPRKPMQRKVTVSHGEHSRTFVMMVLHLKAFGDDLSRQRRRKAAEILRTIVDDHIAAGHTDVVLGGDMNETLGDGAFDILTDAGTTFALTAADAAAGGDAVTWIGGSRKSLIDHIFVSGDAMDTVVDDSLTITRLDQRIPDFDDLLSDHVPVIFRITFGTEVVEPGQPGQEEISVNRRLSKIVLVD